MNPQSTDTPSPRTALQQQIRAYGVSQLIFVAADLGIADLLADGPKHFEELAADTGVNPDGLFRCLRALAAVGVFTRMPDGKFGSSPQSELLRRNVPGSLSAWARLNGRQFYPSFAHLLYSVKTGKSAAEYLHGMTTWEYRSQNPALQEEFDEAMSEMSSQTAIGVVESYDFSRLPRIVDVGGGQGVLISAILKANPAAHGVLFDQAQVIAGASILLENARVASRCELTGGSFFDDSIPGGDVHLLSHILHDWDDEHAKRILEKVRASMQPDQLLLVIERVLDGANPSFEPLMLDITMLVQLGGRERTLEEFESLFASTGFSAPREIPIRPPNSIIETRAV